MSPEKTEKKQATQKIPELDLIRRLTQAVSDHVDLTGKMAKRIVRDQNRTSFILGALIVLIFRNEIISLFSGIGRSLAQYFGYLQFLVNNMSIDGKVNLLIIVPSTIIGTLFVQFIANKFKKK